MERLWTNAHKNKRRDYKTAAFLIHPNEGYLGPGIGRGPGFPFFGEVAIILNLLNMGP